MEDNLTGCHRIGSLFDDGDNIIAVMSSMEEAAEQTFHSFGERTLRSPGIQRSLKCGVTVEPAISLTSEAVPINSFLPRH